MLVSPHSGVMYTMHPVFPDASPSEQEDPMNTRTRRFLSLLLSLSILSATALPAAASDALGEDLSAKDTQIHHQTQLSTNVFWSSAYSDLRTEHFITYTPSKSVTPIVTYGDVLTDRSSVADMAAVLEGEGYRVVAGINGDFYNTTTGLPIGLVITDGILRSSDAGHYAIGFRPDGSAVLGKPGLQISVDLDYYVDNGFGEGTPVIRTVTAVNKARTNSGIYLYTYDFNAKHTTGTTEAGVNVVCSVERGKLAIGSDVTLRVERVEESAVEAIGTDEVVLSVNAQADSYYTAALQGVQVGSELTLSIAANEDWDEVEYAVGALYVLAENGTVTAGLAAGTNPRTAVGQRADGTLIFYTIDGRRTGWSIGASLTQVGERLMELGCETVLCLDGGGSTNLAVTTPDATAVSIVNTPSESGRKVTNQIFLVADDRPSGKLDHFYVSPEADYVLAGSAVDLTVSGVDTHFIPMDVNYQLSASDGVLEDHVLTTPTYGGDITVTAERQGKTGSAVVHAISQPDSLTLTANGTALTELTVTPGSKTVLTAEAVWNHLPLKADPTAFTWAFSGSGGAVDENGVFTAGAPGEGTLTVSAGGKSLSVPVTVTRIPLRTVEDFEKADLIFTGGDALTVSRTHTGTHTARGRFAGQFDYTLGVDSGYLAQADSAFSFRNSPYSALNLHLYGDGSGNQFSFLYENSAGDRLELPVTNLDFTGWQTFSVSLPEEITLTGLQISAPSGEYTDETGATFMEYADTPRTGTVYLDQLVAAFPGTVDNEPPVVTAALDEENWTVTAQISDLVDGVLPADSVSVTYNGSPADYTYDAKTGAVTVTLPAPGETGEAARVTVTAKDASGNIGRASVDVDSYNLGHHFTDIDDYWGAPYVDFLFTAGITTGFADGTFRPDQNISRAQFAVMLYRYLGLDEELYEDVELPFADLKSIGDFAIPAVKALYSEGILSGTEKGGQLYFYPNNSLTRAQAAAMIGRTQAKGYALAALTFADRIQIPAYAVDFIRSMVGQGVISGYSDGTFQPNRSITRGQMAKILYNLM